MTAKQILEMVESVSPDDTAKLDEIDARVFAIDLQHEFIKYDPEQFILWTKSPAGNELLWDKGIPEYTRSRDALKSIRPKLFSFDINTIDEHVGVIVRSVSFYKGAEFESPILPTEELAELHAIIQAIEYERNMERSQGDGDE